MGQFLPQLVLCEELLKYVPTILFLNLNFSFNFNNFNLFILNNIFNLFILILWVLSCLAELNRTPFDLLERESELVSRFNTEFRSRGFTLLFMREYLSL